MKEPTIRQLRHFLLIADCGSFRAAADKAFRSQSALSLSIRELEAATGGKLFRPGRQANLSDLGRRCVPIAREIVERYEQQVVRLRGLNAAGSVTMAVLPSFATRWLPRFLRLFAERHPDVGLKVVDDNSRNVEELVLTGQADLGVVSLAGPDSRLMTTVLVEDRFGMVCNRAHPLARRTWLPWSALANEKILGNLTHWLLAGTDAATYVQGPQLYIANTTSLLALIAEGQWVSPLPVLAVPVGTRSLVAVPLRQPVVSRRIGLIRLTGKSKEPLLDAVEKLVTETMQ